MMRRKCFLYTFLSILWMAFIFFMSAQPASVSQEMSHNIGFLVGRLFIPGFSGWSAERQLAWAVSIDFFVRKGAHLSEYAVLALLVRAAVRSFRPSGGHTVRITLGICFLYACTDEIHQLFVPGRAGMFRDVLIDTAGAAAGLLLAALAVRIWRFCHEVRF